MDKVYNIPNSITAPADDCRQVENVLDEYRRGSRSVLWLTVREGRRFILKGLPEHLRLHPEEMARLRKEYSLGLRINHPGVTGVYGFEVLPIAGPVIVMEYVDGVTLGEFLNGALRQPLKLRMAIARQIADALAYVHSLGLSHRDLKPDNILITRRNEAKIIDIGLGDSEDSVVYKRSLGTDDFGAPEQQSPSVGDSRSDVYSFGKILELLLPERKFRSLRAECLRDDPQRRIPMSVVLKRLNDVGAGVLPMKMVLAVAGVACLMLMGAGAYALLRGRIPVSAEVMPDMSIHLEEVEDGHQASAALEDIPSAPVTISPVSPIGTSSPSSRVEPQKTEASENTDASVKTDYEAIYDKYVAEAHGCIRKFGCAYDEEKGLYIDSIVMARGTAAADITGRMINELDAAHCPYEVMTILGNSLYDNILKAIEKIDGRKME